MDYRRRYTGDNNGGFEESRRRSMRKKPPRGVNWQPTVPNWEKKFCKVVGSLDWETFLYKKRFVHLDDKVVKWNDSAGEDAFYNAKKRFLAQMNGWPCEIPLSSPDLYIDKIDWDAPQVDDQDPVLDLEDDESLVPVKPDEHHEPVVIFGDELIRNLGLSPAGWGDEDEKLNKDDNLNANPVPTGWDDDWLKTEDTVPVPGPWPVNNNCENNVPGPWPVNNSCENNVSSRLKDSGWDDDWLRMEGKVRMEGNVKNDVRGTWKVNNNWENNESSRLRNSGWDDDWLRMECNAKNDVPEACQVSNKLENMNLNSRRYKTENKSSRIMDGRYKWRGGSNNGKREAIVN